MFAWLTIQNIFWTTDRFQRRDCQIMEGASFVTKFKNPPQLLFKCRFTIRVWTDVKSWLALNATGDNIREVVKDDDTGAPG
jgi:hypothetical protein